MKLIFRHLLLIGLLQTACSLAATPDWVSGNPSDYPAALYLIGRGVGATETEAQNRARGDLASIFEVRVQVLNTNTTSVTQSGHKEQIERSALQQVSAKTDKVISGINIAQIWRDPDTQDFHALAVLSRTQASTRLRDEIAKIDAEIEQHLASTQSSDDVLLKLNGFIKALAVADQRTGLQNTLKVIDPTGRGVESAIPQASLQHQLEDAIARVHITTQVLDDAGNKNFSNVLQGGLAAAGFLAASAAEADFVLTGKLILSDLGRQADWNWVRATVEVTLVEKSSGRVRGSKTWPVKASAQDVQTARSRALLEVEKLFKQELRSTLLAFSAS